MKRPCAGQRHPPSSQACGQLEPVVRLSSPGEESWLLVNQGHGHTGSVAGPVTGDVTGDWAVSWSIRIEGNLRSPTGGKGSGQS